MVCSQPNDLSTCIAIGASVTLFILLVIVIIVCCVGVCICRRRKRGNLRVNNEGYAKSDTLETTAAPIDLATGQMSQQNTKVSSSTKDQPLSTDKNVDTEINLNRAYTKADNWKPQAQVPMLPPPSKKPVPVNREQTTNISSELKSISLVNSANSNKLVLASNEPPSDSQTRSLKKGPSYEDVRKVQEHPKQEKREKGSPTYDDILLETSANLPCQHTGSSEEPHKYYTLCDPSQESKDTSASHQYENKPDIKRKEAVVLPHQSNPAKNVTRTLQQCKHEYDQISGEHNVKLTSTDSPQDQYNVLANKLGMAQVQSGVVQEDPAESPVEDKYYTTTRVHRLVPVGKPIGSRGSSHLYQALDQQDKIRQRPSSKEYELVQTRHYTFTGSGALPKIQRSRDSLLRTYGSAAQSLEKLDPMYDEPYKPQRSNSLSKIDIYSLFDDPQYDTKESALNSRVFDNPTYSTRAAASDSQTVSKAIDKHVTFSADTKTGMSKFPEKIGVKRAVLHKSK